MTTASKAAGKNNAILVSEVNGKAAVQFCRADVGQAKLDEDHNRGSGGAIFMFPEDAFEAEFYIKYQGVKARVDNAVAQLNSDLRKRNALDEAGIPPDLELRRKVYRAMDIHERSLSGVTAGGG